MERTRITLHRDYEIGLVDSRIFGGFLEHIGRAVYEGVYDPKSRFADEHGFRKDVMRSLKSSRLYRNAVSWRKFRLRLSLAGWCWTTFFSPGSTGIGFACL